MIKFAFLFISFFFTYYPCFCFKLAHLPKLEFLKNDYSKLSPAAISLLLTNKTFPDLPHQIFVYKVISNDISRTTVADFFRKKYSLIGDINELSGSFSLKTSDYIALVNKSDESIHIANREFASNAKWKYSNVFISDDETVKLALVFLSSFGNFSDFKISKVIDERKDSYVKKVVFDRYINNIKCEWDRIIVEIGSEQHLANVFVRNRSIKPYGIYSTVDPTIALNLLAKHSMGCIDSNLSYFDDTIGPVIKCEIVYEMLPKPIKFLQPLYKFTFKVLNDSVGKYYFHAYTPCIDQTTFKAVAE